MVPSKHAEIRLDAGPLDCGHFDKEHHDITLVEMRLQIKK